MVQPVPLVIEGATLASVLVLLLYALILLLRKYDITQPLPFLTMDTHRQGAQPLNAVPASEGSKESLSQPKETECPCTQGHCKCSHTF